MPWKNGAGTYFFGPVLHPGTTTQLLLLPPDAIMDSFYMRISSALLKDGNFSLFEGCDRLLVTLSTSSVSLTINGKQHWNLGM